MEWDEFKHEISGAPLDNPGAVVRAATVLMEDWGSNRAEIRQLLGRGVQCNELTREALDLWDAQWPGGDSAVGAAPAAAPATDGLAAALPLELRPHETIIVEYSRKQGRGALHVGRQLLAARAQCEACQCGFDAFLTHLGRRHGLNRATCYLFIKFAQWDLPEGLGTAVMKWVVQGFEHGSPLAELVIRAATDERLTLDSLKARYGSLRNRRLTAGADLALVEQLLRERQELLAQRGELDRRLGELETRLQQLGLLRPG